MQLHIVDISSSSPCFGSDLHYGSGTTMLALLEEHYLCFLGASSTQSNMGEQILYIFMGIIGGLIFSSSFMDKRIETATSSEGKLQKNFVD